MKVGNNSGFTLLELLIAMLILAVALIPMLNSFVVNARVNRKAKIKLRSTMIAQDIMEGLKGYSTEDVFKQFNGTNDFRLIDNSAVVDSATHKVVSANVGYTVSGDGLVAQYSMKDLVYQGQKYDAKIFIDGTQFTASGNKFNLAGDQIKPNSEKLADISVMDSSFDGIFMSDNNNTRKEFLDKLIDLNGGIGETINRTFEIVLTDNGLTSAGNKKQLATVSVTYETVSGGSVLTPYTRNYTAYNNVDIADDGCEIRSIYFFYYPAYSGVYTIEGVNRNITYKDKIIFKNEDEIPITLYVMKQKTTDATILPELYAREMMYDPYLYIKEKSTTSYNNRKTTVCTNLTTSLYDGSTIPASLAKFFFGASEVPASYLNADKVLAQRTVNRMFDAVVKVYEEGAAAAGFPDGKLLTTLDSTKINQ